MTGNLDTLLRELKAGLEAIYGPRLKGVYLYGSYARGDQREDSDVDVLVVLDQVGRYSEEIGRTSYLTADLSLEHDVLLSRAFVSETDWRERDSMFLLNVREDAIPV